MASGRVVAIVGAGAAGLVFAKELREVGLDVIVLDANARVGGAFATTYKHAMLTTSNLITAFSSFAPDIEKGVMWTAEEYVGYLESFVAHHNLTTSIKFNHKVTHIKKEGHRFAVSYSSTTTNNNNTSSNTSIVVDHVIVCTGTNQQPLIPDSIVQACDSSNTPLLHSDEIKDMEATCAGRRVLLIGGGESASDLALLGSRVAKSMTVYARSGPGCVVPRYFEDVPGDILMCRAFYSTNNNPKEAKTFWKMVFGLVRDITGFRAKHTADEDEKHTLTALHLAMKENCELERLPCCRFGTKNTSLHESIVRHNTQLVSEMPHNLNDFDVVIAATGYTTRGRFDYIKVDDINIDSDVRQLYKHMYHPELGRDIVFGGFVRPAFGSVPPCAELQARYHALVLTGERTLPCAEDMKLFIEADGEYERRTFPLDSARLPALTDYLFYMEAMADLIRCSPKGEFLDNLKNTDTNLWRKLMYGPLNAHAYRLRGPGATPSFTRRLLMRQQAGRSMVEGRVGWFADAVARLAGDVGIWMHQRELRRCPAPLLGI